MNRCDYLDPALAWTQDDATHETLLRGINDEHLAVVLHVAQHQSLRERGLVAEVIEETALGDAHRRDDFVDRRRGESLREHCALGDFEDAPARVGPACLRVEHETATVPRVQFLP